MPIRRRWSGETAVELSFDMTPRMVMANPAVEQDSGKVAMERGPIVFCMEGLDQTKTDAKTFPLYVAKREGAMRGEYKPEMLGGVMVVTHAGARRADVDALYAPAASEAKVEAAELKLIPYYAWDNREESSMQVWVPVEG